MIRVQVCWYRGRDLNPRTHLGPDLKPGAFDHLSHLDDIGTLPLYEILTKG